MMAKAPSRRIGLRPLLAFAATTLGALTCTSAAAAAPRLKVTLERANPYGLQEAHDPFARSGKTFARESSGNTYTITVTNTGDAPTSGKVEVVDELPKGLVLDGNGLHTNNNRESGALSKIVTGPEFFLPNGGCTGGGESEGTVGVSVATCSTEQPLAAGESYQPIALHVLVSPSAAPPFPGAPLPLTNVGTLPDKVSVSGGGSEASAESHAESQTEITPAVPFGFFSFTADVEELESPFGKPSEANPLEQRQQAGGHPYQYTTNFALNYTTLTTKGVAGASGGPKELQVELPPGFVGDPQNTPRCPLSLLSKIN
jgi:uncharacterized repeat protein (TIGR01451 family)